MNEEKSSQFIPTREEGLRRLRAFLERAGTYYSQNRNYDFGPQQRLNVSELSPYLRHRLITEEEVVRSVLCLHTYEDASKFIEEICWRTYWKGWLQHRPHVWTKYLDELAQIKKRLDKKNDLMNRYKAAIAGSTKIEVFNTWINELREYGYLHNHARMWFASIWIFTLDLPWVLGADFFFQHLLDGDPASNILSWRWVAGLQTRGKQYIAKADNIYKFTGGRFHPINQLVENPLLNQYYQDEEFKTLQSPIFDGPGHTQKRVYLLITEENLSPETWGIPSSVVSGIIALAPTIMPSTLSQKVLFFKNGALQDALLRSQKIFGCCSSYLAEGEDTRLGSLLKTEEITELVTAYVPLGPTRLRMDTLIESLRPSKISIIEKRSAWDQSFWPHTEAGYFKLKTRIQDVLKGLIRQEDINPSKP